MTRPFEDVAVGDTIPERSRAVTRDDVRAYAESSGDRNPLHLDDEAARAAGFSGIVAHGMFTMGHLASALVAWAGSEGALVKLRAPFRAPVFMGETIVAGGTVTALDAGARWATLDVWVRVDRDGEAEYPIRKGEAIVRLD